MFRLPYTFQNIASLHILWLLLLPYINVVAAGEDEDWKQPSSNFIITSAVQEGDVPCCDFSNKSFEGPLLSGKSSHRSRSIAFELKRILNYHEYAGNAKNGFQVNMGDGYGKIRPKHLGGNVKKPSPNYQSVLSIPSPDYLYLKRMLKTPPKNGPKSLQNFQHTEDRGLKYDKYVSKSLVEKDPIPKGDSQDLPAALSYPVALLSNQLDQEGIPGITNTVLVKELDNMTHITEKRESHKRKRRQALKRMESGKEIPFRCSANCGYDFYLPCSCAPSCVVYDNCCEGFEEDCPDTLQRGRTEYADLLDADVKCSLSNVFVITSCRETNLNESYQEAEPTTLEEFILSKAPVYDKHTQLVFTNRSIYNCNKYPQSQGVMWGETVFSIKDHNVLTDLSSGNLTFESLTAILMTDKVNYSFTPYQDKKHGSNNCFHGVHRTCSVGLFGNPKFEEYKQKCGQLTSYVKCNTFLYANHYCMKCTNLFNEAVTCGNVNAPNTERTIPANTLSLLVSFNNDEMVIQTEGSKTTQSWSTISCDLSNGDSCSVVACPDNYVLNENKTCLQNTYLRFSVRVGFELPDRVVGLLDHFLKCKLSSTFDERIVLGKRPTQSKVDDGSLDYYEVAANLIILSRSEKNGEAKADTTLEMEKSKEAMTLYLHLADSLTKDDLFQKGAVFACVCMSGVYDNCLDICDEKPFQSFYIAHNKSLTYKDDDACLSDLESMLNGSQVTLSSSVGIWTIVSFVIALTHIVSGSI